MNNLKLRKSEIIQTSEGNNITFINTQKLAEVIACAQAYVAKVQSSVERLVDNDFELSDWDATMKKMENEIPKVLLLPEVKQIFDIRRGITRLRMAKDPNFAWQKFEEFYHSANIAIERLEQS